MTEYPILIGNVALQKLIEWGWVEIAESIEQTIPTMNDQYLAYLQTNPGATTHDIADTLGELRDVGYQRLIRLEKRGLVCKESVRGHFARWWLK